MSSCREKYVYFLHDILVCNLQTTLVLSNNKLFCVLAATATVEGKMSKTLKKMLKKVVSDETKEQLLVADTKLGQSIKVSNKKSSESGVRTLCEVEMNVDVYRSKVDMLRKMKAETALNA